jgi:hypothetical protein
VIGVLEKLFDELIIAMYTCLLKKERERGGESYRILGEKEVAGRPGASH